VALVSKALKTKTEKGPATKAGEGEDETDQNVIAALARGLSVIRAFSGQREHLTLAEVSKIVFLPRATVRRCLITLNSLGYVESDGKYFRLTPQILTLSQAYFSSSPLPRIAQRYIEQISEEVNDSCSASVLIGDEVIYVARSTLRRASSVQRGIGQSLPAYCTSMGRVLLAARSDEELDEYFSRVQLKKFTHNTITEVAALRKVIMQVRRDDFCIISGEFEHNLCAIAVPVRNASGRTIAAAHISSEPSRTSNELMKSTYLPALRRIVSEMGRLLQD
jgi:IclR family pca regulon transcriptional regulator